MCSASSQKVSIHPKLALDSPETLLTEQQAAEFLGVKPRTLQKWRATGAGPPFVRLSPRCIRYKYRTLVDWSDDRERLSTSDIRDPSNQHVGLDRRFISSRIQK